MRFIDTHTHIYGEEFDADRADVVARAVKAGAERLLLPNIDATSIAPMLQLCQAYPNLCCPMIGLHPTELPADPWPVLEHMEQLLAAPNNPFIAVGEVGVDLYWDQSRREEQIAVFKHQANWAAHFNLPLMVHSRSAHRELVDTLLPLKHQLCGVFHCFGGTIDEANELLTTFPNFVLGIGGVVTFKKSKLPAVLRAAVPVSRIVVETDAPYLTPTPYRGQRNEPAYVPLVIAKLAEVYELPIEQMEQTLLNNTHRIFDL